jgi:hypothetical protein
LLDHAPEVRDRLSIDDRRLRLSRLPDFRQAAGQDCREAWCHDPSERKKGRQADLARSRSGPPPISDVDKLSGDPRFRDMRATSSSGLFIKKMVADLIDRVHRSKSYFFLIGLLF